MILNHVFVQVKLGELTTRCENLEQMRSMVEEDYKKDDQWCRDTVDVSRKLFFSFYLKKFFIICWYCMMLFKNKIKTLYLGYTTFNSSN